MGKQRKGRQKGRNGQSLPDARRDHLAYLERCGQSRTTPRQMQQRDPAPWYLPDLGLTRDPYVERVPPPGELPPVIRTR